MNTVNLVIGPKTYTVACAAGQEAHIRSLGAMIAAKYAQLGEARAPLEAQNLLFAALFLADELDQAKKRPAAAPETPPPPAPGNAEVEVLRKAVARLEAELARTREAAAAAKAPPPASATPQFDLFGASAAAAEAEEALATRLEALAARAEASAAALEEALPSA